MKLVRLIALLAALAATMLIAAPLAQAASTTDAKDAKDEPSAAERRAASSEFEREKLDQGAFDKEAGAAKEAEEGSSDDGGGGSVMRALLGFVVVLGSIFGIHWLLKQWGQSKLQGVAGTSGVIDVVATTPLAQGRALHLVRVGEELVLVGATEQSITRIGEVDANVMGAQMGGKGNAEFQAMLSGAMLGTQPGVPGGMGGASSAKEPFVKRFLDNLRMTTAR